MLSPGCRAGVVSLFVSWCTWLGPDRVVGLVWGCKVPVPAAAEPWSILHPQHSKGWAGAEAVGRWQPWSCLLQGWGSAPCFPSL